MIIVNRKSNLKWIGDLALKPGSNVVADADWLAAKATYPKIEAEWLEPSRKFPEGELAEIHGDSIAGLSESRAARVVLDTFDPELLRAWRKGETRPRVLAAFKEKAAEFEAQRKMSAEKAAEKAKAKAPADGGESGEG